MTSFRWRPGAQARYKEVSDSSPVIISGYSGAWRPHHAAQRSARATPPGSSACPRSAGPEAQRNPRVRPLKVRASPQTVISPEVARAKGVCQCCLMDMEYNLPVGVRDALVSAGEDKKELPQSGVNQTYYYDQIAKASREDVEAAYGKMANDKLLRMSVPCPAALPPCPAARPPAALISCLASPLNIRGRVCPGRADCPPGAGRARSRTTTATSRSSARSGSRARALASCRATARSAPAAEHSVSQSLRAGTPTVCARSSRRSSALALSR